MNKLNDIVGVRYCAEINDWMEAVFFVDAENVVKTCDAARRGAEKFWENEDDFCYGECIERELNERGIPFIALYEKYDTMTDAALIEWDALMDKLEKQNVIVATVS